MKNNIRVISFVLFFAFGLFVQTGYAKNTTQQFTYQNFKISNSDELSLDTVPPADVMEVVTKAINSLNNFKIEAVADLYTPNAVIADDEPPYSWNGPTAGVQWVNSVEKTCKDFSITKLKGYIQTVNVFQKNADNVYIIVPVNFTGDLPGKAKFTAEGAFTFVLRETNGKWMIKSQVWMPRKGL